MTQLRIVFKIVILACITAALTGCAGFRLYSETRDKQGQEAKKAWADVDLKAYFASARDNRKKLLAAEIESVEGFVLAQRDSTLREIVDNAVSAKIGLEGQISGRLSKLVGADSFKTRQGETHRDHAALIKDRLDRWDALNALLARVGTEQEFDRGVLKLLGAEPYACADLGIGGKAEQWLANSHVDVATKAQPMIDDLKDYCKQEKDAMQNLAALSKKFSGALRPL